jgi:PPK2 family polyphosphate:nucleotide phosphotransferase
MRNFVFVCLLTARAKPPDGHALISAKTPIEERVHMKTKEIIKKARKLAEPFRVTDGKKFRLKDIEPGELLGFTTEDKPRSKEALSTSVEALAELQDKLYADDQWALLLIFQGLDAAGKDGAIKHVMSGVNPQGCQVFSFKSPSAEDLDHDYLWRCTKCLPNRGHIGIFNRSYYEETLVVRVHPGFLKRQKLPEELVTKNIWQERFEDIRNFEQYLSHNGVVVRKFFLHVSKKEQKRRFLERIETPQKNWKFSAADMNERGYWDEYQAAYEDMIRHTATDEAPWYVVPADNKWFTRIIVSAAIIETLGSLGLKYPEVDADKLKELAVAKAALMKK